MGRLNAGPALRPCWSARPPCWRPTRRRASQPSPTRCRACCVAAPATARSSPRCWRPALPCPGGCRLLARVARWGSGSPASTGGARSKAARSSVPMPGRKTASPCGSCAARMTVPPSSSAMPRPMWPHGRVSCASSSPATFRGATAMASSRPSPTSRSSPRARFAFAARRSRRSSAWQRLWNGWTSAIFPSSGRRFRR